MIYILLISFQFQRSIYVRTCNSKWSVIDPNYNLPIISKILNKQSNGCSNAFSCCLEQPINALCIVFAGGCCSSLSCD